jgi:hypothetical protein
MTDAEAMRLIRETLRHARARWRKTRDPQARQEIQAMLTAMEALTILRCAEQACLAAEVRYELSAERP